ncbi:MAG: MraY family glycosyltransferase [bacterium]|nr:MraY family glycosyltransferase [bacterium]
MWTAVYAYLFALALGTALLLTPLAARLARRTGVMDLPGGRKPHATPTPLLGGAAILAAVAFPLLLNAALARTAVSTGAAARLLPAEIAAHLEGALSVFPALAAILLGGLVIFLLGLWDDLRDLPPRVKLLGQVMVALMLVALDVRATVFVPGIWFSAAVTVAWVVLITNAFNLLDNMDGLCAGVAVVAAAVFWSIAARGGNYLIASLLAVFAGALVGFLRHNFHPAAIFMGDAGSMFVGYMMAVLTIMQTYYDPSTDRPLAVLSPAVILAVPLYDTLSVVVIRTFRGESVFAADRRHFSHRLRALGMPVPAAVLFICLVTLCTALGATFLPRVGWGGGAVVLAQTALMLSIIAVLEYVGGRGGGDAWSR